MGEDWVDSGFDIAQLNLPTCSPMGWPGLATFEDLIDGVNAVVDNAARLRLAPGGRGRGECDLPPRLRQRDDDREHVGLGVIEALWSFAYGR